MFEPLDASASKSLAPLEGSCTKLTAVVAFLAVSLFAFSAQAQVLQRIWTKKFGNDSVFAGADIDGDGYDDVIIAGTHPQTGDGELVVYRGSTNGIRNAPSHRSTVGRPVRSLSSAGDVDGDGREDVVLGKIPEARLFFGTASGSLRASGWTPEKGAGFGYAVEGVGDVNGDGFDDVAVGEPWVDSSRCPPAAHNNNQPGPASRVHLFRGSPNGLQSSTSWTKRFDNDRTRSCFGYKLDAGDVNGDGYDDLLVGAKTHVNPNGANGKAFLYRGSASGLSSSADWMSAHPLAKSGTAGYYARYPAILGDVNGDGYEDVGLIGEAEYIEGNGRSEFRKFLFLGSGRGLTGLSDWSSNTAFFRGAGDVNADGFSDTLQSQQHGFGLEIKLGSSSGLIPYSPWHTTGGPDQSSELYVGDIDVNGDGHSDIVLAGFGTAQKYIHAYAGDNNQSPRATPQSVAVAEDSSKPLSLDASDPTGDPLTFEVATDPDHGSLEEFEADAGTVTYVPDAGFTGSDQFEFRVEDPFGGSDTARIDIDVEPDNRPPQFVEPTPPEDATFTISPGEPFRFEVETRDPDGDSVEYRLSVVPSGASFDGDNGVFEWTPSADQGGYEAALTVTADDGQATIARSFELSVQRDGADAEAGSGPCADADTCSPTPRGDAGGSADGTNDAEAPPAQSDREPGGCSCSAEPDGPPVL